MGISIKGIIMKKILPVGFLLYWAFTLLLYAFGPFNWITYKPVLFWTLNVSYLFAFLLGWVTSKRLSSSDFHYQWTESDDSILVRRIGIFLIINLFYEILTILRAFLFSSFDLIGLFNRMMKGVSDMGSSYNSFQEGVNASSSGVVGGMIVTVLSYFWDFFAFSTFLFGILFFKKLKLYQKILVIITVLLELISYLARGTNIGVFRVVLAFITFYYISYLRKVSNNPVKGRNKTVILISAGIIFVLIVIILFDKIMKSRGGIAFWQTESYNVGGVHINPHSVFFKILPSGLHQLLVSLSSYLTQGFYGMSLTLRVPWIPMYGIGFSSGLQNLINNFIPDIAINSYQIRIEQFGWDSYIQWHSMYSWFANDISYFGVIPLMGIYGFLFKKALHDSIELNNPYAKLMTYFMVLIAFFLPCNNQIAQSTYTLFAFIYVLIKWQLTKKGISIRFNSTLLKEDS